VNRREWEEEMSNSGLYQDVLAPENTADYELIGAQATAGFCSVQAASLDDVVINSKLRTRRLRSTDPRKEFAAMHSLAKVLTQGSAVVLKQLATLAVELCGAGSGGVSVVEVDENGEEILRWRALAGKLEQQEGGTVPRHLSPCSESLDTGRVMLYSHPGRYFAVCKRIDPPVVECLVVPVSVEGLPAATVWIISHDDRGEFDAEDARLMTSLGSFAAAALRFDLLGGSSTQRTRDRSGAREMVWKEYMRRIAHGDHSALTALLEETSPLVFATALRVLSFRADAEEVTADVFVRIWKTANTYDPRRGAVDGWLVSIARSRAIDRLRSRAARDRSETGLSIECSSCVDPESTVAASETRNHLRQALHALPFEQRRAIELAYFSELTMTEIAQRLGHPIGSVKTRIRMGLMKLRRLLAAVN